MIERLPTDYVDSVADEYKYKLKEKQKDVFEVIDETEYTEIGSFWTASNINTMHKTVNQVNDAESENAKSVDEIILGTVKENHIIAKESVNAPSANVLNKPAKINDVDFDGSTDITIEDKTKVSSSDSFILAKNKSLSFISGVCTLTDSRIKETSLANVIFSKESVTEAFRCVVTADTFDGNLKITAKRTPKTTLVASILIRS